MQEPTHSFQRKTEANGDVEVLVLRFEHGVELRVAGELGLRMPYWKTSPQYDPEAQRLEVARAIDWAREHDEEIRTRIRKREATRRLAADARRLARAARFDSTRSSRGDAPR